MDPIDHIDLRGWELNLVVALDALLQERSVTRSAARAGVGQPAMSHALSRLRALLGDELLVRSGRAMEPTSRALELAGPVREALLQLRSAFRECRPFAAEAAERTFFLGMTDYTEALLPPSLAARLATAAPGAGVAARDHGLAVADMPFDLGSFEIASSGTAAPRRMRAARGFAVSCPPWPRAKPVPATPQGRGRVVLALRASSIRTGASGVEGAGGRAYWAEAGPGRRR